jgi:hypothetical protein
MSEMNHTKLVVNHLGTRQEKLSKFDIKETNRTERISVNVTDNETVKTQQAFHFGK